MTPGSPTEAEQVRAQEEAKRSNPEAVRAREESETKYEGLGSEAAEGLINSIAPSLVDQPAGGPPVLPEGESIVGFPSVYAMSVVGGDGSREVREGLEPVALEAVPGQRVPIDLSLSEANGSFQPKTALVPVRIPKHLSEGAALSEAGVSLTPVDGRGVALAGEGVLDGASVFYGDSEGANAGVVDVDTLVKPSTFGLMMETSLRSQRSPSKLFFKVGLPEEATLEQESSGSGTVHVVKGGKTLAVIFAPSASDAEGTPVPVGMVVEGSTLVLTVNHPAGAFAYPIKVDPRYESLDAEINGGSGHPTNWHFEHNGSYFTGSEAGAGLGWTMQVSGSHGAEERGWMAYTTQGLSHVWDLASESAQHDEGARVESESALVNKKGEGESVVSLPLENSEPIWNNAAYCQMSEKCKATPEDGNSATYGAVATGVGTGKTAEDVFRAAEVRLEQEVNPEVAFDTTDETVNGHPNALYGSKTWLGPHSNAEVKFTASDKGIGVEGWSSEHTNASGGWESLSEKSMMGEGRCSGIQCPPEVVEYIGYSSSLPDGEPKLGLDDWNAMYHSHAKENEAESLRRHVVKVDSTPPHSLVITGVPSEINAGEYHLKAEATDGSGTTPSSGIKSIELLIDGKQVGSASGSCEKGPCTATAEWAIVGRNYATGKHIASLVATDNAGNVASGGEVAFTVHPASSAPLGPGSVNLASGEFALGATDVSMGGGLTVGRSFDSRHLGAGGPLGPFGVQWGLSLGGQESLVKLPDESMVLTTASGSQATFASNKKGGFESPTGDSNLTLSFQEPEGIKEYVLKDAAGATSTGFRVPSGGSGEVWAPSIEKGPVATDTVTYSYETATVEGGQVTRPTEALAPVPAGVSCSPTLEAGCRALKFVYATATKAKGESESEWGEYNGRLKEVLFIAYNPATKEMSKGVAVAQYEYDSKGRLRAEWDPRISPALKTVYGYDEEGHVTALTPPGEETWAFTYGSIAGDASSGRILKVAQAPAHESLWNGIRLVPETSPKITGTVVVGNKLSTTNGAWGNFPIAYGYQWYDCNPYGEDCTPIPGATNPNYTPSTSDIGHALEVYVTATNGDGSSVGGSNLTKVVGSIENPEYKSHLGTWESQLPVDVAVDAKGDTWVAVADQNRIDELNVKGEYLAKIGSEGTGNGQFKGPKAVFVDAKGNVWVADTGNNRIQEFSEKGEFQKTFGTEGAGNGQLKNPQGVTVDAKGNVWVADTGNNRVQEFNEKGEYVRKVGGEGTGNGQFKGPKGIAADAKGNIWVADSGNDRVQKFNEKAEYLLQFGSKGLGEGKFLDLEGVAIDAKGNIWTTSEVLVQEFNEKGELLKGVITGSSPGGLTVDSKGNVWVAGGTGDRVEEFNEKAEKIGQIGSTLREPNGVAVDAKNDVWVTKGAGEVEEFNEKGEALLKFGSEGSGNGQLSKPEEISLGSNGDVWVADTGNDRIEEFNGKGEFLQAFGKAGEENGQFREPQGVVVDSKGHVWVVDTGNDRVEEFNEKGEYLTKFGKFGEKGAEFNHPERIIVSPQGNLWVTNTNNNHVEEYNEKGEWLAWALLGEGNYPAGAALDGEEALWVAVSNNASVQKYRYDGYYEKREEFGKAGWGNGQFETVRDVAIGPNGSVWVADSGDRVEKWSSVVEGTADKSQPGFTVEYGVPLSGSGVPDQMTESEVAKWGQKDDPTEATAIFPPDEAQGWPASSYKRATIYYLDAKGRKVNVASPGGAISTSEYNESNDAVRSLTADNRAAALAEGTKSAEVAKLLDTESKYNGETKEEKEKEEKEPGGSAAGTQLLETLGPQHAVRLVHGKTKENEEVQARNHTVYSYDEGAPTEGAPYRLVTKVTQGAQVNGEADRDVRTVTNTYSGQEGLGWKLRAPTTVTASPSGLKLAHTTIYENSSTGNVTETRGPASTGEGNTHDTKTIYYSAAANTTYPACGEHPQWANLPCQTLPGKQPEPALPVTTTTYNIWGEPETITRTVGSATRTTTMTYDPAGRLTSTHATSTTGIALPTVNDKYSETTGQLLEQSRTTGSETKTITSTYDTLGRLTKYTDANGNTTEYEYEYEKDGRLTHVNDGKGTQAYTYEETTGALTKLVDTQGTNILTFTAAYDVEGNMTSESYPNGMTASYAHNAAGETTGLTYEKKTHCSEKCVWFTEALTPSIHNQTLEQVSSLTKTSDTYDEAGRLTQVQETPTGEGCTTRLYEYDEEANRKKLTTRSPGTGGACATEGGTSQTHTYDNANRLTDTGATYDTFGDITKLPAPDAGGSELQSTFYVDGQLDEQKQGSQTIGYGLDPDGRILETVDTGMINSTYENHYAGSGDAPSWTIEPTSGHWKRYVSSIGGLAAIETDTTEPVLQLTDLHRNVIATASVSETATKLLSTERSTEYGVPTTTKPEKYSWLGGDLLPTELPSGIVAMGARSYVSQIGRFLQPDPVPGGSANTYAYTDGNPINETDLTGDYVENDYLQGFYASQNQQAIEKEAAREAAARREAEEKARIAAAIAAMDANIAAEEAVTNAQDLWDAEAKESGEDNIAGGGMVEEGGGSSWSGINPGLEDCSGGCHTTPAQEKCVQKAGDNRSQGSKCFPPKGSSPTPVEACILAAGGAVLVSWIPGVDVDTGDAAAAACAGALHEPPSEIHRG